jgi:hypothetical protein
MMTLFYFPDLNLRKTSDYIVTKNAAVDYKSMQHFEMYSS